MFASGMRRNQIIRRFGLALMAVAPVPRVKTSTDRRCKVGTLGHVTLFASYNGVRSDSVQFIFPTACKDHNHMYHGPQVNNQVPPL
jgi:hypothetical protein